MMILTQLPENILEKIFYNKLDNIYNNSIINELNTVFEEVKILKLCYMTCKLFKIIIEIVINYLYDCNKNILMELYELNFDLSNLNIITKYMYTMGINMNNLTNEKNNLIIFLIDNHYYSNKNNKNFNNYIKLLTTLLKLNINPNIKNIYENTGLVYNLKMIFNDDSDNIENILFDTINTYIDNQNSHELDFNIQDNVGNTALHIIMQMLSYIINYDFYPKYIYDKVFVILDKIKYKTNIKNNNGNTALLLLLENREDDYLYKIVKYLTID